ncbi:zinc-dependent peptidase [Hanstruepera ponticola]|uniref:zinc-dependent peptidase n=1 Tax=Hanstruepera ponticola TaxID=2042995 RepID=UPI001E62745C|nr:zinc-dependent peptidase [Hanstruepera ponticola]
MNYLILIQDDAMASKLILGFLFAILFYMMLHYAFKMYEMTYVMKNKKPLYRHGIGWLRKLPDTQKKLLHQEFSFFRKLKEKEQRYFEHRVASFIKDKTFIGRDGLNVTDKMRVLISATAVMLTFGFRDFYIGLVGKIFIYPDQFFSNANGEYHKGELNPKLGALVISWKHFLEGYDIENDNLNLGIHEFAHAIHLNSLKERDVSSTIFSDSFRELTELLSNEKSLRERLIESQYFREYAYTNQYEFIAVIIETFIETPHEFRSQFPQVYNKTKQMLNFGFAGY